MQKKIVIGVVALLVLLLLIVVEAFYLLKIRRSQTIIDFNLEEIAQEEKETNEIEGIVPDLAADEMFFSEINRIFNDVFDIISPDEAVNETDIRDEEGLADLSQNLADQESDKTNFQEIDELINGVSY